jgi:hypothetical protein
MRILFGGQDVQTCAIGLIVLRHDPRSSRRHRPTELLRLSALQEGEAPIGLYTKLVRRSGPSIVGRRKARMSVDRSFAGSASNG